jgi:tRNA nucleotidyltransferase (CCA-adding enzyme)
VRTSVAEALARSLVAEDLEALREVGRAGVAFLVGGAVRDALLGIASRDLDVVVEGDAHELAERLAPRVVWHPRFGTASLTLPSGARLDLAESRRETYERPAALPSVTRASLESDLARRDFTVNAMAVALDPARFGVLVDPLGGERDLRDGLVRVLHDASFLDDPTRAFRAVALCARLRFRLERRTARLLRDAVREGAVERLSRRRLGREIEKLFSEPHSARAAAWLDRTGLLPLVSPSEADRATLAALRRSDRAVRWFVKRFPQEPLLAWTIPLAILSRRRRRAIVERLGPDRRTSAILLDGVAAARRVARRAGARPSAIARACRGVPTETLLLAVALPERGEAPRRIRRYLEVLRFVRADVTGHDLLRRGVDAGPRIARGLRAALDAKLDRAAGVEEQLRAALRA